MAQTVRRWKSVSSTDRIPLLRMVSTLEPQAGPRHKVIEAAVVGSEHRVLVSRVFGDRLPRIPVLDNLAVAQPEEVEAGEAAIIWP